MIQFNYGLCAHYKVITQGARFELGVEFFIFFTNLTMKNVRDKLNYK